MADADLLAMAAVLAILVLPVLLISGLAVSAVVKEPSLTTFMTATLYILVMGGVFIGLLSWFRDIDHAET